MVDEPHVVAVVGDAGAGHFSMLAHHRCAVRWHTDGRGDKGRRHRSAPSRSGPPARSARPPVSHVAAREPPSSRDVQVGAMASFTQELKLRGTRVRTFFEDRFPNAAAARADSRDPVPGTHRPSTRPTRPVTHGGPWARRSTSGCGSASPPTPPSLTDGSFSPITRTWASC